MYELINTSLPNGLIPGTHGFATVAMTKGLADSLRMRIEAFCSYTHRTSSHDDSYYKENPTNWFCVKLPQGEHIVGRVAPSDFDYTGRTNRLARLRIFGDKEMPEVGGAVVLEKGKEWFKQPWCGDPRYLDEDRNTAGQLRMASAKQMKSAPAWDAHFGVDGSRLARQMAWQLEKNLSAGGKAIYFKTSTVWDINGEKLLGLFSDLIKLLPVQLQSKVTFSTYSASLPDGTGCALRGIYDRDRFFDSVSATQAWVDCENHRVVNAELLPSSAQAEKLQTDAKLGIRRQASGPKPTGSVISHGHSYSRQDVASSPGYFGERKTDKLFVGIIVAIVIVVIIFFVTMWMIVHDSREKESNSYRPENVPIEVSGSHDESLSNAQAEKEEAPAPIAADARQKADPARKDEAERERNREEEDKRRKDLEAAAEKMDADEKGRRVKKKQWDDLMKAFTSAQIEGVGKPKTSDHKPLENSETNELFSVYYYIHNGVLTNEVAQYKSLKVKTDDSPIYIGTGTSGRKAKDVLSDSPVVLWMKNSKVWFDWSFRKHKESFWFEQKGCESRDLQIECFGKDENVFKTWEKVYNVVYLVEVEDGDGRWISIEWNKPKFSLQDAVNEINMKRSGSAKKNNEKVKRNKTGMSKGELEAAISQATNQLSGIQQKIDEYKKNIHDYDQADNAVKEVEKRIREAKSEQEKKELKGNRQTLIDEKNRKGDIVNGERGKLRKEKENKIIVENNIKNLEKELKDLNGKQKGPVDTGIPEEVVRKMKFRVSVVDKGSRR